jgi:hypothetical protein
MDDLVKELTKKLGVNRKQAQGGLVAILRAGRQNLSAREFAEFVGSARSWAGATAPRVAGPGSRPRSPSSA